MLKLTAAIYIRASVIQHLIAQTLDFLKFNVLNADQIQTFEWDTLTVLKILTWMWRWWQYVPENSKSNFHKYFRSTHSTLIQKCYSFKYLKKSISFINVRSFSSQRMKQNYSIVHPSEVRISCLKTLIIFYFTDLRVRPLYFLK